MNSRTDIIETNTNAALAAKFINSTSRSIFLTGKAGTGKTTFLRELKDLTYKNIIVVAPTGIAAINAKGTTIHSQFQIPPCSFIPEGELPPSGDSHRKFYNAYTLISQQRLSREKIKVLRQLELLVIDEVSMLRADLLDAIDQVLKSVRHNHGRPFGGVQVLFIGDLQQLPPVVKDDEWSELGKHYNTAFFFDAHVLRKHPPLTVELNKIYRQSDDTFISLLNNLRNNRVTAKDAELLNTYYKPGYYGIPQDGFVQLTTHNHKADAINTAALQKLKAKTYRFKAKTEDKFPESMFPIDQEIEMKIGAQIMFTVNDREKKYFNGKIGTLTKVSDDEEYIEVLFNDGKTFWIGKHTWDNIEYTTGKSNTIFPKSVGKFVQFPIRLAWAITVHKSQGLTFPKAIIDLEQAFAPGQIYVALSRLKSLDGLVLSSKVNFHSLRKDQFVHWYETQQETPEQLEQILDSETKYYVQEYVASKFDLKPLLETMMQFVENGGSGKAKTMHSKYRTWARMLVNDLQPAEVTSERFVAQIKRIGNDWDVLKSRIEAAKQYFTPFIKDSLKSIEEQAIVASKEKKAVTYIHDLEDLHGVVSNQLHLFACAEIILKAQMTKTELQARDLHVPDKDFTPLSRPENEEDSKATPVRPGTSSFQGVTKSRAVKGGSAKQTLALYRDGKNAEEIAKVRGLSISTIMSHFAELVAAGSLKAEDLIAIDRLETIRNAAKEINSTQLTPLRQHLGETFSYDELRIAFAKKDEVVS